MIQHILKNARGKMKRKCALTVLSDFGYYMEIIKTNVDFTYQNEHTNQLVQHLNLQNNSKA